MARIVAVRRRRVTTGTAAVAINATAAAAAAADAPAWVMPDGSAIAAVHQVGEARLLGEGCAFPAAAGALGEAEVEVDATGRAAAQTDTGFPYTFPIIFGGAPVVEGEALGAAVVTIDATATAAAEAIAQADVSIIAPGLTVAAGFPYTFPISFGSTFAERFPYELPITL